MRIVATYQSYQIWSLPYCSKFDTVPPMSSTVEWNDRRSNGLVDEQTSSIAVSKVPLIGSRWYIITQLAVYTTYIPLVSCQLGDYMLPIPPIKGTRNNHWLHLRKWVQWGLPNCEDVPGAPWKSTPSFPPWKTTGWNKGIYTWTQNTLLFCAEKSYWIKDL